MRSTRTAGAMATAVLCGGLILTGCDGTAGGGADAKNPPASASAAASDSPAAPTTAPPGGTPSATAPGGTPSGGPAGQTPPTSPPPSSPPGPPASAPENGQRLVTATVSGGFDGRRRSVLVNNDGSYTAVDRKKAPRKGQLKPAELAELRAALAASDFARLPRVSMASPPVADGITTAVIHQGREVATDGMKKIPKLDRVIAALPGLD